MPIFNGDTPAQRGAITRYLEYRIQAPYVHAEVSTLGGVASAAAMIKVSLDSRVSWMNGIFHNSRYFMIRVERNGELEQFARSHRLPKMRKTRASSMTDAVLRINKYIAANK